jgi:DNA-binding CsgD family transcriptional regulator/PAS domain-containing protein
MAVLSADHRELFLPLIEGIHESPPWGVFLRNLVARMQARRAFMIITLANAAPDQAPAVIHVASPRAAHEPRIDFRALAALRLHPHAPLRPGRVYALDEMLDYDDRAQLVAQRTALHAMGIRYGRFLRVSAGGAADAWLVLVREREDFSGSAVAVLDAVAVHLAAGLRTLAVLCEQRLQTALATAALGRLGVGQLAFDGEGRVMACDPLAEAMLTLVPEPGGRAGRRLQLRADAARRIDAACQALAADTQAPGQVIRIDEARAIDLLLRRSDLVLAEPGARPAVIGVLRTDSLCTDVLRTDSLCTDVLRNDAREAARAAIRTLAARHGLSANEAALAHALSQGERLAEAGARLNLTVETARNYSKRIYAKTGARGQADLVRIVLTGLAPLA